MRPSWKVQLVPGSDFQPLDLKFVGSIPQFTNFGVYHFQKAKVTLKDYYIYVCFEPGCHKLHCNLSKFYDHIRSHSNEKPFECPYHCGKKFTQVGNMNKHVEQIHFKVKRYACSLCGRKFTKKFNMKMHELAERNRLK